MCCGDCDIVAEPAECLYQHSGTFLLGLSIGFAALLDKACPLMRSQGGELKLLNLTKRVRFLLQVTKLITVFDITDDEAASVKSFSPAIWSAPLLEPSAR